MPNRITIYVKCNSSTQLYWREAGAQWAQLVASGQPNPPTISTTSTNDVTFEFLKDANSQQPIRYSATGTGQGQVLPTSNGPTTIVTPGNQSAAYFAEDDGDPTWYTGYVSVSED